MDRKANAAFYGSTSMTPEQIFESSPNTAPDSANEFVQALTAQTRRLPGISSMQAGVSPSQGTSDPAPTVRTYGIGDPNAPTSNDPEFNDDF
jgi:hypothetical protein